ncbi:hypothetical protein AGR2A_Lc30057 [Agrobacterium genomosp. 2 str. CFBP 5494]|uniref:Uncharacterized protein n=1 Tax=Agrobacterium genomosp. 2 str. CFBP 5494 TaxID=1183436 RepID=A0A9W5F434_9HYPH|nr:hypothetical protein AGR2A_Lc30057 [Agrobacterium genomosp. 2 str. CFBP 5494]
MCRVTGAGGGAQKDGRSAILPWRRRTLSILLMSLMGGVDFYVGLSSRAGGGVLLLRRRGFLRIEALIVARALVRLVVFRNGERFSGHFEPRSHLVLIVSIERVEPCFRAIVPVRFVAVANFPRGVFGVNRCAGIPLWPEASPAC